MIKKSLNILSLIFARVVPLGIIAYNYAYIAEEGRFNFALTGWFLGFLIIYFAWYKPFKSKVEVWEIQDTNQLMVINFKHLRVISIFTVFLITVQLIQLNIAELRMVLFYILISLLLGWALKIFSIENKKA
jgi:hypothetical protein